MVGNMASGMDLALGVEGKRGPRERAPREEERRKPRGCMAKMQCYSGMRNWQREARKLEKFRAGPGRRAEKSRG